MAKPLVDYSIYLVLDPDLTASFGMVETAVEAAKAGATLVQLRAPDWKKRQYFECAAELKKALEPFDTKLIINDHVDVALAMDADGVHVGQKDLPVEKVRELVGPKKSWGFPSTRWTKCALLIQALLTTWALVRFLRQRPKKMPRLLWDLMAFKSSLKQALFPALPSVA